MAPGGCQHSLTSNLSRLQTYNLQFKPNQFKWLGDNARVGVCTAPGCGYIQHTTQQTRVQIDVLVDYLVFTIRQKPDHITWSRLYQHIFCSSIARCVLMCRDVSPDAARAGPWPRVMQIPGCGDTRTFTRGCLTYWDLRYQVCCGKW